MCILILQKNQHISTMLKTATAANKSRGKTFCIRYHGNVYSNRCLIGQKNQTASTAH